LPSWEKSDNFYPLRVPLRVRNRDIFVKFAQRNGILLGDWYDTPVAPREVNLTSAGYKRGSCPNTEKVCDEIVNLPIHINLSDKDLEKIVKVIESFYSTIKVS
jgi:dTDP-4-amino-4,6-dideoxygalactose transaminase